MPPKLQRGVPEGIKISKNYDYFNKLNVYGDFQKGNYYTTGFPYEIYPKQSKKNGFS
jgi:hypothetical protein